MSRSDPPPFIGSSIRRFLGREDGSAAIEFAGVFPILVALLLGSVDGGRALWMARKLNTATQSVGDILAREAVVSADLLDDVTDAAALIIQPFNADSLGYDVIGIQFDPDDGDPEIAWRETDNMPIAGGFPERADGLGSPGEGVLAIAMRVEYRPIFINVFTGPVIFERTAILRGRQTPFVEFADNDDPPSG
ncbi:MAG: TadE/TadG family type IV pilus assembly protein [Pseudomonadota bacterium]